MSPGTIFIKTLMSNLQQSKESNSGFIAIPMAEHVISEPTRNSCWECNFSEQFPISSVDSRVNIATVIIGPPHVDYKIITHLKNQKMDGESTLISNKSVLIATLTFVEGVANGPCTIFDENGVLFFEGSFVNGYRQGKGKEYDENGTVVYEGLYDKGKKLVKMIEMEGYWKEYDDNMNLRSVCKKDDEGQNDGVCFYYENGEVKRLSEWHEGNETPYTGYFKLYDERNRKWVEGEYKNGVRNGVIKEYDINGSMMFEGYYESGKKLNMVRLSEMAGYWKEYDENGNLKSICKRDKYGRYEDICYFYENGEVKRLSEWHEGNETPYTGYFKLYDERNRKWIEGEYKNGVRNGVIKESDENGSMISECLYSNGIKLNVVRLSEMAGYWKEYDQNGNLKSICKIDDCGRYEGICYFFENGKMTQIREWHEGKEKVYIGKYKYYDEPSHNWIEGFYYGSTVSNRIRMTEMEGYWKEYDYNGNLIHICELDNNGNYNGICYTFENGNLQTVCRIIEGRVIPYNGYYEVYNAAQNQTIEGYYGNGNPLNMVRFEKMEGYWKEYDQNGNLKSICKKDSEGRYEGVCYFYENGIETQVSNWHEGIQVSLNGRFEFFDEPHKVRCEGGFRNGLREGKYTEYDENGDVIYEGYYKRGNKLFPIPNKKHFWEERDSNGNLCRICQLDRNKKYNGLSYQYHNNQITRVSRWKDDKEIETMKLFNNGIMKEIKNGNQKYVGEFNDSIESNYQREGEGEEYNNDGVTLLYKGSFKNGKRNGKGKLYKKGNIAYDGEWIEGLQRIHFFLIIGLILALAIFSTAAAYYYGNVYVGTYLIGIYATALCFYLNKYAGYVASALLLIMIGFFIHLIAGIVISVVIAIAAIFYINVFAGVIPVGMILIAICMYFHTHFGVLATGLFIIYLLYYIIRDREWPKPILYYSAGGILFTCILICLILGLMLDSMWRYILMIIVIGLLLTYMAIVFAHYLQWKKDIVYFSIVAIILICLDIFMVFGSMKVVALQYVLVFAIGLSILYVIFMFAFYNNGEKAIIFVSAGMILFGCIFSCLVIAFGHTTPFKVTMIVIAAIIVIVILWALIDNGYGEMVCEIVCTAIIVAVIAGVIYWIKNKNTGDDTPDISSIMRIIWKILKVVAIDIVGFLIIKVINSFCDNKVGKCATTIIGFYCWLYTLWSIEIDSPVLAFIAVISIGIGAIKIIHTLTNDCNDCQSFQLWFDSFVGFMVFSKCCSFGGPLYEVFKWLAIICFCFCCCMALSFKG